MSELPKDKAGIGALALDVALAIAPTFGIEVPLMVRMGLMLIATTVLLWAYCPKKLFGRSIMMSAPLALIIVSGLSLCIGIAWLLIAPKPRVSVPDGQKMATALAPAFKGRGQSTFDIQDTQIIGVPHGLVDLDNQSQFTMKSSKIFAGPEGQQALNEFPAPTGEYSRKSNEELRQAAQELSKQIREFSSENATEYLAATSLKSTEARQQALARVSERAIQEFDATYAKPLLSLSSELVFRTKLTRPNRNIHNAKIWAGWAVARTGRGSISTAADFLEYAADQLKPQAPR